MLDYSCVMFSKDCDIKYTSQSASNDSIAHGSPHQQSSTASDRCSTRPSSCHKVSITMRSETKISMVPKQVLYESEMNKTTPATTVGNFKTYIAPENRSPETCVIVHTNERVDMSIKWEMAFRIAVAADSANYERMQETETQNYLPPAPLRTVDIVFTGASKICYYPFIDKKRSQLQKYFFPQNYEMRNPTPDPSPGGMREPLELLITVKFNDALVDFKFNKKGALSEFSDLQSFKLKSDTVFAKMRLPYVVGPKGFQNTTTIQFKHCKVNSNIPEFPSFIRADFIEVKTAADIPLFWNYPQHWRIDVGGRRVSLFYIQLIRDSISAIVNDFGSKEKPDLLKFVPAQYKIFLDFDKVEAIFPVHQYNWLTNVRSHSKSKKSASHKDAHGSGPDINEDLLNSNAFKFINAQKVTGEMDFNFLEFLPTMLNHKFRVEASNLELSLHLPDSFPSKHILKSLAMSLKDLTGFDSRIRTGAAGSAMDDLASGDGLGARGESGVNTRMFERYHTFPTSDAVELIQCAQLTVSVDHKYHPIYYTDKGNVSGYNLSLPKRTPKLNVRKLGTAGEHPKKTFDQVSLSNSNTPMDSAPGSVPAPRFMTQIEPDLMEVTVSLDQVVGVAYGTAIKHVHAFIMNIFGSETMKQFERRSTDKQGSSKKRNNAQNANNAASAGANFGGANLTNQQAAKSPLLPTVDVGPGRGMEESTQHSQGKQKDEQMLRFYATNRPTNSSISIAFSNICLYLPGFVRIHESCPIVRTDILLVEISNSFKEFRLQVLASPITIVLPTRASDSETKIIRPQNVKKSQKLGINEKPRSPTHSDTGDFGNQKGWGAIGTNKITLAGLQVRLQGFSNVLEGRDRSVAVEYSWLTELKILPLRGKISLSQLMAMIDCIQGLAFLMKDETCKLQRGEVDIGLCMHLQKRDECTHKQVADTKSSTNIAHSPQVMDIDLKNDGTKPTAKDGTPLCVHSEDLKYRMVRIHVDKIDINLVEPDLISNIQIHPVKMSWCNLHTSEFSFGGTLRVDSVSCRQFVSSLEMKADEEKVWVEAGGFKFGPVFTDASSGIAHSKKAAQQEYFLRSMDHNNRKLFFLERRSGDANMSKKFPVGKCGCRGNCAFFGTSLLENGYYDALSVYDMRDRMPNIADDFSGEIGGTVGVAMLHRNRKYRFPVFQSEDLRFATLKHEVVANRVNPSNKEYFRSCSPSIDLEAEKTLTEMNRSEYSSPTMTESPKSVIRHPSASSVGSGNQAMNQTLTTFDQSMMDKRLFQRFPVSSSMSNRGSLNLERDATDETDSAGRRRPKSQVESQSGSLETEETTVINTNQISNSQATSGNAYFSTFEKFSSVSSSLNSQGVKVSSSQEQDSKSKSSQNKSSSNYSSTQSQQQLLNLSEKRRSKDDDASSLNESFKSAVSVISSETSSLEDGNTPQLDTLVPPAVQNRKVSPFAHLMMEHVVNFDRDDKAFHGSATVVSDATAYQLNNAKLMAYYQYLLPQAVMENECDFDEVDMNQQYGGTLENIVHVDSHGHVKSKILEPGLDLSIIVERDVTEIRRTSSRAPIPQQAPSQHTPVNNPFAYHQGTPQSGSYQKQRQGLNGRTSASARKSVQINSSKPGEYQSAVMVNFEDPICVLFTPLMMGGVCRYLDCCSAYIKTNHPGDVLFKLHRNSVKAASAYMEADDLSDSTGALNKDKESPKSVNTKNAHKQNQDASTHQNPSISIDMENKDDVAINFEPAHSFTFTVHVSEVKLNILQALVDDTLLPNSSQISGASLISSRVINLEANLISRNEQVLSPEGNVADNVEIILDGAISQVEAQLQHLKSNDLMGKEDYITNIAQEMSQCTFTVSHPKTKSAPGWIMTEGGFSSISLSGIKRVGYHDPLRYRKRRASSMTEPELQMSYITSTGSHQGPIKDEPFTAKYSDSSQANAVIDLIWFNAASPANRKTSLFSADVPRSGEPISQPWPSLDYNLLTTGTFTIAAWLKQFDEIRDKVKAMTNESKMRFASVLACAFYFFIFDPNKSDFDIRTMQCDFEHHLTPLAKKLRHDHSVRTFVKLFQKLIAADVVVMDYALRKNPLSLDTLHHSLYNMCQVIAKHEKILIAASKQTGKGGKHYQPLHIGPGGHPMGDSNLARNKSRKNHPKSEREPKFQPEEEVTIPINIEQFDEQSTRDAGAAAGVNDYGIYGRPLQPIGEENLSRDDEESEDSLNHEELPMTLDTFDIEKAKQMSSDEAVQRWLINSERDTTGGRVNSHVRIAGGTRISVLPEGVEVTEDRQMGSGKNDTFKFSDTMSPNENKETRSLLSRKSSVVSMSASDVVPSVAGGRKKRKKDRVSVDSQDACNEKETLLLFKAVLQAVKAYKDNAEQYEFTKIFGKEVFVNGKIVNFRIDVVSKMEPSMSSFASKYKRQRRPTERDPVFYTQNFEVKFSLKEQQSTLPRRSTLPGLKDKSQRNSLFIDCLITLAKTTYKLDFSVVKLINQVYCSVQKIHEELGWNRVLKDHEINTKGFPRRASSDNMSRRSSYQSDVTEDDEGKECWVFISSSSKRKPTLEINYIDEEDFTSRPFDLMNENKDDSSPGRIVTHIIASWLAAEFCTEIGGLVTKTFFDSINVSYWGRQTICDGKSRKETDSNVTTNIKQLDITIAEAEPGHGSTLSGFDQSILTFIVKNTGFVLSSKEKRDKQKRSYLWFNIKDVSLNIPLQPAALRQTVDKTTKRFTELKSKLPPMPQAATAQPPKDTFASQRSGLNNAGVGGATAAGHDNIDGFGQTCFPQHESEPQPVPFKTLQCESLRETHFKARLDQLEIKTALLVDFTAAYNMSNLRAFGKNSRNVEFDVILSDHYLQFQSGAEPANLKFPNISLEGIYVPVVKPNNSGGYVKVNQSHRAYEGGNFLVVVVNVSRLEEQLNTDLLNHFIIVQEVFRSELQEVISRVSENTAPNGWNIMQASAGKTSGVTAMYNMDKETTQSEDDETPPFMLNAKLLMDTLIVTATTPTNNAVQLYLDTIEVEVFNFPKGDVFMKRDKKLMSMLARGKLNVDASLGIIRNFFAKSSFEPVPIYAHESHLEVDEEARNPIEKKAFLTFGVDFETTSKDQKDDEKSQAVRVTVSKFKIYLEPQAIEHTFKIYINYKNAFEYFTSERHKRNYATTAHQSYMGQSSTLGPTLANSEFNSSYKRTTEGVSGGATDLKSSQPATSMDSSSDLSPQSRLYFLLLIQDLAVCVPLEPASKFNWKDELEQVLLLTIKSTSVSAVSNDGLFSVGTFKTFTLGFREDFDVKAPNWMIDKIEDSFMDHQKATKGFYNTHFSNNAPPTPPSFIMNTFWVPEGSVEVASKTKTLNQATSGGIHFQDWAPNQASATISAPSGPVWELSIKWQMKGLHVRFDTKLGKWLMMMKNTFTLISDDLIEEESDNDEVDDTSVVRGDERKKYQEQQMVVMKLKGDRSNANSTRIAAEEYTLKHMEDKQAKQQIKNLKRLTHRSGAASSSQKLAPPPNQNSRFGASFDDSFFITPQHSSISSGTFLTRTSMAQSNYSESGARKKNSVHAMGQSSTVSGPGSPLTNLAFGPGGLGPIAGSPSGSLGGLGAMASNSGYGQTGAHIRAQSVALGTFQDFSPIGGIPYSNSQQTVTGATSQFFEPLRTANKAGSISNTNKWSDDEEEIGDKDALDTMTKHDVHLDVDNPAHMLHPATTSPRFHSFAHSSVKAPSSGTTVGNRRHTDPTKYVQSQAQSPGRNDQPAVVGGVASRPSTLFLRSNQQQNMAKGMAIRFDLDISISSGECVLHADAPTGADPKLASPVKGSRRMEPNLSHITLPAINLKTFYVGDSTAVPVHDPAGQSQSSSEINSVQKDENAQTEPTVKTQTSYSAMPKEELAPSTLKSNPSLVAGSKSTYATVFSSMPDDAATTADFHSIRGSAVPLINVHSYKDNILKPPETSLKETLSLRSSKVTASSTHRHGKLCMWIVVQKLEDPLMRLSPCFLDYIQQTLNIISEEFDPYNMTGPSTTFDSSTAGGTDTNGEPTGNQPPNETASADRTNVIVSSDTNFPVDVVIALIVETFEIDIDCYPHDKISCTMLLPQTNIVFSSVRNNLSALDNCSIDMNTTARNMTNDFTSSAAGGGSKSRNLFFSNASVKSTGHQLRNVSGLENSATRNAFAAFSAQTQIGEANGWIVTVVADDFNVFVYHQFKLSHDDARNLGGMSSSFGYNFSDNSRKDAFSLSVKSVRLNICRNATLHLSSPKATDHFDVKHQIPRASAASGAFNSMDRNSMFERVSSSNSHSTASCERYRFINMSIILDFGECQFKFDIRKLSDLRTFIKHWYRESLIKQAFIGPDRESTINDEEETEDTELNSAAENARDSPELETTFSPNRPDIITKASSSGTSKTTNTSLARQRGGAGRRSALSGHENSESSHTQVTSDPTLEQIGESSNCGKTSTIASGSKSTTKWESNVIVAANFSSFEVNMQLDSFMGSIKIRTEKLLGTGLLHLTSDKHKVAGVKVTLGRSELSSIAATINPSFHLRNWALELWLRRPPHKHPSHTVWLNLNESEFRMNYKSNPILMGRFNMLKLQLDDSWKIYDSPTSQIPCKLTIKADISWDNAQLLTVQSTFSDFIIIKSRFIQFYNSYFNAKSVNSPLTTSRATGGSVVSSLYSGFPQNRNSAEILATSQGAQNKAINWRRHWPGIVADIISQNFPFLPTNLSSNMVLLGGRIELKGDKLSVVLMENDIRSSRWLALTLQQPLIAFVSECQHFDDQEMEMLMVEQNLSLQLLHDASSKADRKRDAQMAEIKLYHRIGDGSCPIMVASAVKEWFAHTLKNTAQNNLDEVVTRSYYKVESSLIASLPRVQTNLSTEQKQTLTEPFLPERSRNRRSPVPHHMKPPVECKFMSNFHQPIQVALDPKYIEIFKKLFENCTEKIKMATAASKGIHPNKMNQSIPTVNRKLSKLDDPREYNVISWNFDPSIKFITGTASSTDPPGVNWLWKKLGIENCKPTLPKFTQRYLMDNLDAAVAKAVLYDIKKLSKLQNRLPDVVQK